LALALAALDVAGKSDRFDHVRAGGIGHLAQWGPLLKIGVCGGRDQSSLTGQHSFKNITNCVGDITA
jgi:hypothetical protein